MALTFTVFFGACNKDNQVIDMDATIVTYGNAGSKVYVDGGENGTHFAYWNNGDTVMINGNEYYLSVTTNSENQTIAAINGVAVNSGGYYAIYPCDRVISSNNGGYPSIQMPQVQIYRTDGNGHQLIKAPMAAYSSNSGRRELKFTNLCSLIEVYLPVEKEVAYINVTSDDNFLWGKATISGTTNPSLSLNDNATAQDYTTSNKTVTLDCSTNGYAGSNNGGNPASGVSSAGPFYIVVPARSYSNLKVDVYVFDGTEDGHRKVYRYRAGEATTHSASTTVASNMIYTVEVGNPERIQPPYPYLGTGEFSVSPTKKVRFAMGNLQYQASTGMWRFAETQLVSFSDGEGNLVTNNRDQQALWIDLFGFGTSGKGGYYPTTYTNSVSGNYATTSINGTLNDWGVNEISNGGNQPNKWRTLTRSEWQFLMAVNYSSDAVQSALRHDKQVLAVVHEGDIYSTSAMAEGILIAPDDYTPNPAWQQEGAAIHITPNQYNAFIQAGCIFLPMTGGYYSYNYYTQRIVLYPDGNELDGFYWSSTYEDSKPWAFKLKCETNGGGTQVSCVYFTGGYEGCAVRLVRDVD